MKHLTLVLALFLLVGTGCSSNNEPATDKPSVPQDGAAPALLQKQQQKRFDDAVTMMLDANAALPKFNILKERLTKLKSEQLPKIKTEEDADRAIKSASQLVGDFYLELGNKLGDHKHDSK